MTITDAVVPATMAKSVARTAETVVASMVLKLEKLQPVPKVVSADGDARKENPGWASPSAGHKLD